MALFIYERNLLSLTILGTWVFFTWSIHELLAHLGHAIEKNGNVGLKSVSEENLESSHKVIFLYHHSLTFITPI